MISFLRGVLRSSLYHLGVIGVVHRIRNRDTLTVLMFHRVLPKDSDSYQKSEREFTFTVDGFARCLDFIQRHYCPISLKQLKDGISGGRTLPPCAVLITFDDGWRDTLIYALPELQSRNIPAVSFLTTEVTENGEDRWWQDMLVEAMHNQDNELKLLKILDIKTDCEHPQQLARRLAAKLSELPIPSRIKILKQMLPDACLPRQMLRMEDLGLLGPLICIGGHGHTHGPLTNKGDPVRDLITCRELLVAIKAETDTMSFPHGAYDSSVIYAANQSGFKYLFSSDPFLVATNIQGIAIRPTMGRIHVPENEWTCDGNRISYPKLATYLFFREIA